MSSFVSQLRKFFTKDRIMILVIFLLLTVFLLSYSSKKNTIMDGYQDGSPDEKEMLAEEKKEDNEEEEKEGFKSKSVANPSELLPSDANSEWEAFNPMSHNSPDTPDLLKAGYHIGLDTVGQTMKNANLQLRSDPVIQKVDIGPWNQSTIEPDMMRVPLEVGAAPATTLP